MDAPETNPYEAPRMKPEEIQKTAAFDERSTELLYQEQKPRSIYGCACFLLVAFLAGGFSLATIAEKSLFTGAIAAFLLFVCFSYVHGFFKNEVWRFGIREDSIWWDSPRWPRSAGNIPLEDVCHVKILDGTGRLEITRGKDASQRIRCFCGRKVRDVLTEHYPHIVVEFIEGT